MIKNWKKAAIWSKKKKIPVYNDSHTLKTSVLILHVNHDSNFLGIWSVYF